MADNTPGILGYFANGGSWPQNVWNGVANWATSPGMTNFLRQQGGNVAHAGGIVALGGTGLDVAGTVSLQPEIVATGIAGEGLGGVLNAIGSGAMTLSDILAKNRNSAVKDAVGAGLGPVLPPTIDPQPWVNRAGQYFGF